jgi:hypothetical protein
MVDVIFDGRLPLATPSMYWESALGTSAIDFYRSVRGRRDLLDESLGARLVG